MVLIFVTNGSRALRGLIDTCFTTWRLGKFGEIKVVFSVLRTTNLLYLDEDDATLLLKVYNMMYPDKSITTNGMNQLIQKFGRITVGTTAFGSKMETRSVRSSRILASWHSKDGSINVETFSLIPGIVRSFFSSMP